VKNASAFNTTIDCRFHIQIGTGRASVAWAAVLALGFLSLVISFIHFCHFSLFFLILKKQAAAAATTTNQMHGVTS
jgi:hypothetical protein